jgi:hypothetical protein
MPTDNDAQAKALVEALAPLIAAAIIPQLTASVEEQVKGIKSKNDELLDKLANVAKDKEIADKIKAGDDLAAKTAALLEGAKKPDGLTDFRKVGEPVRISRADARDVALYRKAKDLAASQKVSLEIVGED